MSPFNTGSLTISPGAARACLPEGANWHDPNHVAYAVADRQCRKLLERHASGDYGDNGRYAEPTAQDRDAGDSASRAAKNSIAITDGVGEVVSHYPVPPLPGRPPAVVVVQTTWSLISHNPYDAVVHRPSTVIFAQGEPTFPPI
jgi:hypothetical protein